MEETIRALPAKAKEHHKRTKKFFAKLAKKKPASLDSTISQIHDEVFSRVDCLECANCCKTTSPIFTDKDIGRIASHLKMRPAHFVDQYLHLDHDGDFVLNSSPCTFLGADNYCGIYDVRPRACREYPHTNRKKFYQILNLTQKNMAICPAVFEIVEQLEKVALGVK